MKSNFGISVLVLITFFEHRSRCAELLVEIPPTDTEVEVATITIDTGDATTALDSLSERKPNKEIIQVTCQDSIYPVTVDVTIEFTNYINWTQITELKEKVRVMPKSSNVIRHYTAMLETGIIATRHSEAMYRSVTCAVSCEVTCGEDHQGITKFVIENEIQNLDEDWKAAVKINFVSTDLYYNTMHGMLRSSLLKEIRRRFPIEPIRYSVEPDGVLMDIQSTTSTPSLRCHEAINNDEFESRPNTKFIVIIHPPDYIGYMTKCLNYRKTKRNIFGYLKNTNDIERLVVQASLDDIRAIMAESDYMNNVTTTLFPFEWKEFLA